MTGGIAELRRRHKVPAKRGMRVDVYYRAPSGAWGIAAQGKITSATPDALWVNGVGPYRPRGCIVYLNEDYTVLLDTRTDDTTGAQTP